MRIELLPEIRLGVDDPFIYLRKILGIYVKVIAVTHSVSSLEQFVQNFFRAQIALQSDAVQAKRESGFDEIGVVKG